LGLARDSEMTNLAKTTNAVVEGMEFGSPHVLISYMTPDTKVCILGLFVCPLLALTAYVVALTHRNRCPVVARCKMTALLSLIAITGLGLYHFATDMTRAIALSALNSAFNESGWRMLLVNIAQVFTGMGYSVVAWTITAMVLAVFPKEMK
jgi:hypothetical protein